MTRRLAIDIGGTFTDLVYDDGQRVLSGKVLTTSRAPEDGVMAGTAEILAAAGVTAGQLDVIVHGTTLATNAILERKGPRRRVRCWMAAPSRSILRGSRSSWFDPPRRLRHWNPRRRLV